jgi:hypothetical protein
MMRFDEFGMYDDAETMALLGLPTPQAAPIAAPAPSGINITDGARWNWWDQGRGGQVGVAGSLFDQLAQSGFQPVDPMQITDKQELARLAGMSDADVQALASQLENGFFGKQWRNGGEEQMMLDALRQRAVNGQAQQFLDQTGFNIGTTDQGGVQTQVLTNPQGQEIGRDVFDWQSYVNSENKAVDATAAAMAAGMTGAAYFGGAGLGAAGGGGGAGAGAAGAGGSVVMTPMGPAVIPAAAGGGAVGSVGSALPGLLGTGAAGGLGASMGGVPIDPTIAPSFGNQVGQAISSGMGAPAATAAPGSLGVAGGSVVMTPMGPAVIPAAAGGGAVGSVGSALTPSFLSAAGAAGAAGAGGGGAAGAATEGSYLDLLKSGEMGSIGSGAAGSSVVDMVKAGGSGLLSGISNGSNLASIVGGIAGAAEAGKPTTATTQQQIDPRMAQYLYGTGYGDKNSFLGAAQDWWKNNQSGMNANMTQGLDTLKNLYTSPGYTQGYTQMRDVGQGLLGRPIAGNPFTQGGGLLGTPMQQPMQPPGPEVGVPRFNMPRSI